MNSQRSSSRTLFKAAGALLIVGLLIAGGFAFYLANAAGELPWQTDPTRIPVTPFGDIPGFQVPTIVINSGEPAGTPVP